VNISSVIINLKDVSFFEAVCERAAAVAGCEVCGGEGRRVVAVLESESFEEHMAAFRALEALEGVADVVMVYDFQELGEAREKAECNDIGKIVRAIDEAAWEDVRYNGNPNL